MEYMLDEEAFLVEELKDKEEKGENKPENE